MEASDIVIIGAGPAGMFAAIAAARFGGRVMLLERNSSAGKKLLLTGGGRCNLTNTASLDTFIDKFKPAGEFLRSAFFAFSNEDLMDFFRAEGLALSIEERGRVVTASGQAACVLGILECSLNVLGVRVIFGARVEDVARASDSFLLRLSDKPSIAAARVIIATGGGSYGMTGSTGDGIVFAERLGHAVVPLSAGLVPLIVKERWVKDLQGITLSSVRVAFSCAGGKFSTEVGELLFTHFGISGPLVLDNSARALAILAKNGDLSAAIDLIPGTSREDCATFLGQQCRQKNGSQIKSALQQFLPKRMATIFLLAIGIRPEKAVNQITKEERRLIAEKLKAFTCTITGSRPLAEAMVTCGGVAMKDINPRTMESRRLPGLYFAGEVIDGRGPSGGYNLQQAFSTGFLAGQSAARSVQ